MTNSTAVHVSSSHAERANQTTRREWDAIVAELAQIAIQDDSNALTMGDRFVEIEQIAGEKNIKKAAEEAGIPKSTAAVRYWVSKRISPAHRFRTEARYRTLNWTHLRALAGVKDEAAQSQWAEQAIQNQWSSQRLRSELEHSEDHAAQQQGAPCARCGELLQEDGVIITIRVSREQNQRFCSKRCGIAWLEELIIPDVPGHTENGLEDDDPFGMDASEDEPALAAV